MKTILAGCFCLSFLFTYAQDKNKFYALDVNLHETVLDSSAYILWVHQKEDSNWQFDYYKTWGPLVKTQTFSDRQGTVLNGRTALYNSFGNIDSTGLFRQNKKNGQFLKYRSITRDSVILLRTYDYSEDSLVNVASHSTDSVSRTGHDTAQFKPAMYPGFRDTITLHLKYPARAAEKKIQGKVIVGFEIDKAGNLVKPFMVKSAEYSLDQEAIRVMKEAGKWEPAQAQGENKTEILSESLYFRLP